MKIFLNIGYTIGYTIALFFILYIINCLINLVFIYAAYPAFEWFYGISFGYKIILFLIGAPSILFSIFGFTQYASIIITEFLLKWFTENSATIIISIILVIINIVLSIIEIWDALKWDFWIIIMWLIMVVFIIQMNAMLVYTTTKKSLSK